MSKEKDLDEMSVEELKEELKELEKENLQEKVKQEREKVKEREKQKEEQKEKELYDEVKAKVLADMKGESTVEDEKDTDTLNTKNSKWMNFREKYAKDKDVKPEELSYEKVCENLYRSQLKRGE